MHRVGIPLGLSGFRVERVALTGDIIEVYATPARAHARCPSCHHSSRAVHSRYTRSAMDLPWSGARVTLHLRVRRWRCRAVGCPQRIFCEHLPALLAPHGRRTRRLLEALRAIGRALGGRPGARLARPLRVPVSRMTLLRLVRAARARSPPPAGARGG